MCRVWLVFRVRRCNSDLKLNSVWQFITYDVLAFDIAFNLRTELRLLRFLGVVALYVLFLERVFL